MEDAHEGKRYFTVGGQEIKIRKSSKTGLYYIKPSRGKASKKLQGSFTTFKLAEQKLISYLKSKERVLFKAVYPR